MITDKELELSPSGGWTPQEMDEITTELLAARQRIEVLKEALAQSKTWRDTLKRRVGELEAWLTEFQQHWIDQKSNPLWNEAQRDVMNCVIDSFVSLAAINPDAK